MLNLGALAAKQEGPAVIHTIHTRARLQLSSGLVELFEVAKLQCHLGPIFMNLTIAAGFRLEGWNLALLKH